AVALVAGAGAMRANVLGILRLDAQLVHHGFGVFIRHQFVQGIRNAELAAEVPNLEVRGLLPAPDGQLAGGFVERWGVEAIGREGLGAGAGRLTGTGLGVDGGGAVDETGHWFFLLRGTSGRKRLVHATGPLLLGASNVEAPNSPASARTRSACYSGA